MQTYNCALFLFPFDSVYIFFFHCWASDAIFGLSDVFLLYMLNCIPSAKIVARPLAAFRRRSSMFHFLCIGKQRLEGCFCLGFFKKFVIWGSSSRFF